MPAALVGAFEKLSRRWTHGLEKYVALGHELRNEFEAALGDDTVLLYPSYTRAAPRHHWAFATPFDATCTALFNTMQFPVTQIPIRLNKKALPLGLQVIAARGQDGLCLQAAEVLERAFGGWQLAPSFD